MLEDPSSNATWKTVSQCGQLGVDLGQTIRVGSALGAFAPSGEIGPLLVGQSVDPHPQAFKLEVRDLAVYILRHRMNAGFDAAAVSPDIGAAASG